MKTSYVLVLGWLASALLSSLGACAVTTKQQSLPDPAITITTALPRWEYKTLELVPPPHARTGNDAMLDNMIPLSDEDMNALGAEGWELVSTWLEPETAYPAVGGDRYVPFLKENIRPLRVVLLFKRQRRM